MHTSGSSSSNIDKLVQRAQETQKVVKQKTTSYSGNVYSYYQGTEGVMYEWAKEHIVATNHLKWAIASLEKEGKEISPHIYKALEECEKSVKVLAKWVDSSQYLKLIFAREPNVSPEGLLKGIKKIKKEESEWHINLGLLMNAYHETDDPELKKQISFLAIQYLAKAAPIEEETQKSPFETHQGFFQGQTYHREFSIFEKYLLPKILSGCVPKSMEQTFLLDTKECGKVLSVFYSVINKDHDEKRWAQKIETSCDVYLKQGDFSKFMQPPLLFDFTEEIGELILQSKEEDNTPIYKKKSKNLSLKSKLQLIQQLLKC